MIRRVGFSPVPMSRLVALYTILEFLAKSGVLSRLTSLQMIKGISGSSMLITTVTFVTTNPMLSFLSDVTNFIQLSSTQKYDSFVFYAAQSLVVVLSLAEVLSIVAKDRESSNGDTSVNSRYSSLYLKVIGLSSAPYWFASKAISLFPCPPVE